MIIYCPKHKNEHIKVLYYHAIGLTRYNKRTMKKFPVNFAYCIKCKKPYKLKVTIT